MKTIYYNLIGHAYTLPHLDVIVQSGTVRGIYPTNELSRSYAASEGTRGRSPEPGRRLRCGRRSSTSPAGTERTPGAPRRPRTSPVRPPPRRGGRCLTVPDVVWDIGTLDMRALDWIPRSLLVAGMVALAGTGSAARAAASPPRPPVYVGGHIPEIFRMDGPGLRERAEAGAKVVRPGFAEPAAADRYDAKGNPTTDARILFIEGSGAGPTEVIGGTYKLTFTGQATLAIGDAGTIENQKYDAATNTTTADVVIPASGRTTGCVQERLAQADYAADATGSTRGFSIRA